MKTIPIILATLASISICSGAVVTYNFKGVIDTVEMNDKSILGVIGPNDTISGSFSFDPIAAGGGSASDRRLTFKIGSRSIDISSTLNFVRVQDNVSVSGLGIVDRFRYAFDSNGPTPSLDPLYLYGLDIQFIDSTATLYDGTQTLDVDLNLMDYDITRFSISGADLKTRSNDFSVRGTITSVAIPEPSALSMIAIATLLVIRRGRKSEQGGDGDAEEAV